jgi:hypothetical protein
MTVAWFVYTLLTGALAGLAALASEAACRVARRPARWAWAGALGLTLLLAAAAPWRGPTPTGPLAPARAAVTVRGPSAAGMPAGWRLGRVLDGARAVLGLPARWVTDRAKATVPRGLRIALLGGWGVASVALLAAALGAAVRLRRQKASWPIIVIDGGPVRLAPHTGPAAIGITRPEVVAPAWLLACPAAEQGAVLAHEREHVRAQDPRLLAAAGLVGILLPWHPAVWWMLARLRLAVEVDCDRRVLRSGFSAAAYGGTLVRLAGVIAGTPPASLLSSALSVPGGAALVARVVRPRDLERRLVAMTTPKARHPRLRAAAGLTAAALATISAGAAAPPTTVARAASPRATSPAATRAPRATGAYTGGVGASGVGARGTRTPDVRTNRARVARRPPLIFIDGRRADTATLARLSRAEIASIDVFKGDSARRAYPRQADAARGVVRVTTRAGRTSR